MLLAQGTSAGGFTFYVKDRRLHYTHNWVARELLHVASDAELSAGRHALRFEFEPTGMPDPAKGHGSPGRLQLYIDGELVGDREVPYTTPFAFNPGALTCGADPGIDGHDRLRGAVPLHRDHPHGDRRPQRRADQRPRGRAQAPHGTPVADR